VFTFKETESMSRAELLKERRLAEGYLVDLVWLIERLQTLDEVLSDLMPYYPATGVKGGFGMPLATVYNRSSDIQIKVTARYKTCKDYLAQIAYFLSQTNPGLEMDAAVADNGDWPGDSPLPSREEEASDGEGQ